MVVLGCSSGSQFSRSAQVCTNHRWFFPEILKNAGSLGPRRGRLRTEVVLGQLIRHSVNFEAAAPTRQKHGRAYE